MMTLGIFGACSKQTRIYMSSEFPSYNSTNYRRYDNKNVYYFSNKVYTMSIYEISDTFENDSRQKYLNRRTASKSEVRNSKEKNPIQTISLVFLDDRRVLYYTLLQNTPDNKSLVSGGLPKSICLTDNFMSRDLAMTDLETGLADNGGFWPFKWLLGKKPIKRHYYHGIYNWTSDTTIDMKFQKNYALKANFEDRFVTFHCIVPNPKGERDSVIIDRISYTEKDIVSQNSNVDIKLNSLFNSKFKTIFTNQSFDTLNPKFEVIYRFGTKDTLYNKFTETGVEKSDYSKINAFVSLKELETNLAGYQVAKCIVTFPFANDINKSKEATIAYTLKNKESKTTAYQLSDTFAAEIKGVIDSAKSKGKPIISDTVIIEGATLKGFFNIYDRLGGRNKKDFRDFINKIALFDDYRVRIFKDKTYYKYVENSLVTVPLEKAQDLLVKIPITYRQVLKDTIQLEKKGRFSTRRDTVSIQYEFEFTIDSITVNNDVVLKKYYFSKDLVLKNRAFYRYNACGTNYGNLTKRFIRYLENERKPWDNTTALAKCEAANLIKKDANGYYIEEIIKDANGGYLKTKTW